MKRKAVKITRADDCTCCVGMLVGATGPNGEDQHADNCFGKLRKKCDSCPIHVVRTMKAGLVAAPQIIVDEVQPKTVEEMIMEDNKKTEAQAVDAALAPKLKYPDAQNIAGMSCLCGFPFNDVEPIFLAGGKLICSNCAIATVDA